VLTEHSSKVLDGSLSEELTHQIKDYYEAAALVLAVSRAVAEKLQRLFNLKALEVMPNMLDDLYLQPLHKKPINLVFTIASVGRLDKNKNQILIIEAMPYLKAGNAILKILGDGATKEDLHNTVGNLKLSEKVAFKGHLPSWQIRQELLSADVLVITSKVETFSVVAIEALACGLPVITTKCGGPQDIITEENGEIVGYDSSEMANAINKMISGEKTYDPITIRANCLKKYSGDVVAENLQKKYEEIIRS
jgi:glycosyltransferase involved in cell wall biosynthesis